jgi:hypothetical protein
MNLILTDQATDDARPEWLRIPNAVRIFGISRTKLYELIAQRRIKSVSLRERGQTKGTRLLSYDSLMEYLDQLAESQN